MQNKIKPQYTICSNFSKVKKKRKELQIPATKPRQEAYIAAGVFLSPVSFIAGVIKSAASGLLN